VATTTAGRRRDGVLEEGDQLTGSLQGAAGHHGPGDAAGVGFVAVGAQDVDEVRFARSVHHVSGGAGLGGVHAHVERGVEAVAEPSFGPVELGRTDPQVEQRPHQTGSTEWWRLGGEYLGEVVEPGVYQAIPAAEASKAAFCRLESHPVPVESQHPEVSVTVEQRLGVPGPSDGCVQDRTFRYGSEQLDDLVEHDGQMPELPPLEGLGLWCRGCARFGGIHLVVCGLPGVPLPEGRHWVLWVRVSSASDP